MATRQQFMRLAIQEARKSVAEDQRPHPNVGALAVKGTSLLDQAHRGEVLGKHAEEILIEKMKSNGISVSGCTVYTTLEPCTGRNSHIPCVQLLADCRPTRVIVGMLDPNHDILGQGILILQEAGIKVDWFPSNLHDEIWELSAEYIREHRGLRPGIRITGETELRDRDSFIQALFRLTPANLNRLITALGLEARGQVSDQAPHVQRVNELVGWVESSSGPQLDELQRVANKFVPNFKLDTPNVALAGPTNASKQSLERSIVDRATTEDHRVNILRIRGGKPLHGEITVRGAKNTLPKDMLVSLLTGDDCLLRNVAKIRDVDTVANIIMSLGGTVQEVGEGELRLSTNNMQETNLENLRAFVGQTRVSPLLAAPLLHRFGHAFVPKAGGCYLGVRAIDYHVEALKRMGADVQETPEGLYVAVKGRLHGCEMRLPYPSVGATEQILLAASLAQGTTVVSNASIEPEVTDLIDLLTQMGADIVWNQERQISINGRPTLVGFDFTAMTDRSEVGSWACAAIATSGSIFVQNAQEEPLKGFLERYEQMGGNIQVTPEGIGFSTGDYPLKPLDLETGSHPSFRTDWQPPLVVALTQAVGISRIHETVFEDRLQYIANLQRMKARISTTVDCLGSVTCRFSGTNRHSATVEGPSPLSPTDVTIDDLRGGFASLIAALIADGESTVRGASVLYKGYEKLTQKLSEIGADIVAAEEYPL